MIGNVNLPDLFPAIRTGFTKFTNEVSSSIANAFSSVGNTVSNLVNPDHLFISNNVQKSNNNAQNFSFFGNNNVQIDKSIIGRSEGLAAESLKRVSTQQLKDAGSRNKAEFFKMLLPAAKEAERIYGVPASVTLAQAALESGWGKSAIGGYNIFGIKGKGSEGSVNVKTKEYLNGKWVTINDNFAKYSNFYEAVMKHGQVFQGNYSGYKNGLNVYAKTGNDYAFIDAVGHTYATDPDYASSVKQIMKDYDLVNMAKNYYVI